MGATIALRYVTVYACVPEVYPTAVRSVGMGAASAFGRVGGILAPMAIGVSCGSIGFEDVFVMTTPVRAARVVAVVVFGLAIASRTPEGISSEELGTRSSERGAEKKVERMRAGCSH